MNDFGYPLEDLKNNEADSTSLLAGYLNQGALSVILGAGASSGFGLPGWRDLVVNCSKETNPKFKEKVKYTTAELKVLMDSVKKSNPSSYIDIIKSNLYKDVSLDFSLGKKELLIAVTSLIIGRARGNVRNIMTYDFDNILEWYLEINGINTNVTTFEELVFSSPDVDILHIHGYIPYSDNYGKISHELVFSKEEFENRQVGNSYWKKLMYEFFRRNVFLTVGLSPESLIDDICPYLRELTSWYKKEKIKRRHAYGVAIITPGKQNEKSLDNLVEHGIIPIVIEKEKIPSTIFNIAQKALANRRDS